MKRVPAQRFEAELLDAPISDLDLLERNFHDMARVNRYLGGNWAVLRRVGRWIQALPPGYTPTILDIATGAGQGPQAMVRWAARQGRPVRIMASDIDPYTLAVAGRTLRCSAVSLLQHDALQMPFADASIDILTCTLSLHHFAGDAAVALLREMTRVARYGVVINDLRRCWPGYWGARLLAATVFGELSKTDAPLSVLRSYTPEEARRLLREAGIDGTACAEPVFRLTVVIEKIGAPPSTRISSR